MPGLVDALREEGRKLSGTASVRMRIALVPPLAQSGDDFSVATRCCYYFSFRDGFLVNIICSSSKYTIRTLVPPRTPEIAGDLKLQIELWLPLMQSKSAVHCGIGLAVICHRSIDNDRRPPLCRWLSVPRRWLSEKLWLPG